MSIFSALKRLISSLSRVDAVAEGIDNQSKQLATLIALQNAELVQAAQLGQMVEHISSQHANLLELIKAQLVMQRDQADAIDALAAAITAYGAMVSERAES